MTKKPLRWFMVLMLTGMVSLITIYGINQIQNGGFNVLLAIIVAIFAIVVIAGVEIDYVKYGSFVINFSSHDDNDTDPPDE